MRRFVKVIAILLSSLLIIMSPPPFNIKASALEAPNNIDSWTVTAHDEILLDNGYYGYAFYLAGNAVGTTPKQGGWYCGPNSNVSALASFFVMWPTSVVVYNGKNQGGGFVDPTGYIEKNGRYYYYCTSSSVQYTAYIQARASYYDGTGGPNGANTESGAPYYVIPREPVPVAISSPSPSTSSITQTSFKISWASVANAASYSGEYSTNSSFTNSTPFTTSSTSYTISGLTAGTTYYVRVKAVATTTGNYADSSYGSTNATTADIITLSAPTVTRSSITTSSIYYSLSNVSNATSYQLQYATNSSFSGATTLISKSGTITGLSPNTTYYFRAKALTTTSGYTDSAWGSIVSSTTAKLPLSTPSIDTCIPISATSIKLTYNKVSYANQYIIEYSTSSSFTTKQTITVT